MLGQSGRMSGQRGRVRDNRDRSADNRPQYWDDRRRCRGDRRLSVRTRTIPGASGARPRTMVPGCGATGADVGATGTHGGATRTLVRAIGPVSGTTRPISGAIVPGTVPIGENTVPYGADTAPTRPVAPRIDGDVAVFAGGHGPFRPGAGTDCAAPVRIVEVPPPDAQNRRRFGTQSARIAPSPVPSGTAAPPIALPRRPIVATERKKWRESAQTPALMMLVPLPSIPTGTPSPSSRGLAESPGTHRGPACVSCSSACG